MCDCTRAGLAAKIAAKVHRGSNDDDGPAAIWFQYFHDFRLVRAPQVRPRVASVEGHSRIVGDCVDRVLHGGTREPVGLRCPYRLSAEDHPRGYYLDGLSGVRGGL